MVSGGKLILVIVSSIHLCFTCESPIENKNANRLLLSQVNPKVTKFSDAIRISPK